MWKLHLVFLWIYLNSDWRPTDNCAEWTGRQEWLILLNHYRYSLHHSTQFSQTSSVFQHLQIWQAIHWQNTAWDSLVVRSCLIILPFKRRSFLVISVVQTAGNVYDYDQYSLTTLIWLCNTWSILLISAGRWSCFTGRNTLQKWANELFICCNSPLEGSHPVWCHLITLDCIVVVTI